MYFTAHPAFFNVCTTYSIKKKNLFGESGLPLKAVTFSYPSTSDMTSVAHTNYVGSHLGNLASCTVPHAVSVSWMHQSVAQFWHLYPSRSYPNYTGKKKHSSLSSFHLLPTVSLLSSLLTSFLYSPQLPINLISVVSIAYIALAMILCPGLAGYLLCPAHSSLMHWDVNGRGTCKH